MRFLAVSDEIDEQLLAPTPPERAAGARFIVSCGDLPSDYLESLADRFRVPLLYVRGNHDSRYENPPPGDDIDGRIVTVDGVRLLGFEGCMWYNGEGVQYTEQQMWWRVLRARAAALGSRGVDIVVAHASPFGVHDGRDRAHTGYRAFLSVLRALRPRYFVHGHNHLSYVPKGTRVTTVGETQVVNAFRSIVLEIDKTPAGRPS